jgi:hypothetical protein
MVHTFSLPLVTPALKRKLLTREFFVVVFKLPLYGNLIDVSVISVQDYLQGRVAQVDVALCRNLLLHNCTRIQRQVVPLSYDIQRFPLTIDVAASQDHVYHFPNVTLHVASLASHRADREPKFCKRERNASRHTGLHLRQEISLSCFLQQPCAPPLLAARL